MLPNYAASIIRLYLDDLINILCEIAVPVSHGLVLHVVDYLAKTSFCLLSLHEFLHYVFNVHYHGASFPLSAESPLNLCRRLTQLVINLLLPATHHLLPHSADSFSLLSDDLLQHQIPLETFEPPFVMQEGRKSLSL